jgi:radical SAM protein with 4Fe4S-binding SPASM domain
MRPVDFAVAPFLVIWETTQTCALACRHCCASAQPGRDPGELTTEEGLRLVDQVADVGTPILILSGGDPVNRPDLLDLVRHGKSRGLRVDEEMADFVQKKEGFVVKETEAPHYRRPVAQREMKDEGAPSARSEGPGHTVGLAPRGVNSGNGFLFVSHVGEIMPSGFLPIPVGNVREMAIAHAYRETPLFRQLRTPSLLKGRCGRCEFRDICGGSRSRAYGLTGDPFETDPWCSYEPAPGVPGVEPPGAATSRSPR